MVAKARRTELNARKRHLLEQTITSYIRTAEPVGSKRLSETSGLSVSSATIRNDLNELEREGYLTQVHLSSGRVPTDKGYRLYVDGILHQPAAIEPMQPLPMDVRLIGNNIQQILTQVTDLMGNLVDYTTIVLTPDIYQETLKIAHLVLVQLDVVLVVLMNTVGMNSEFLLKIQDRVDQETLNKVSRLLTEKLNGLPLYNLTEAVIADILASLPLYESIVSQVVKEIRRLKRFNSSSDKLMMRGMSNMIKLPEFRNMELTQKVLSTLEETKVMLSVFSEYISVNQPQVVIGDEHQVSAFKECSMVVAPYSIDDEPIGIVGVLGPRRMDYDKVIPMVQMVSEKINAYLENESIK
jgi:heat-inducible transcriptional repressor